MPKTLFCLIITVCMLLLVSCAKTDNVKAPDLSGDISVTGCIESSDISAELNLSRQNGVWTAEFTSPDSVKGMTITCDNGKYSVAYSGISFDYGEDEVPFKTAVQYITESINAASDTDSISVSPTESGVKIAGSVLSSGYVVKVGADNEIQSVSVGGYSFTAGAKDGASTDGTASSEGADSGSNASDVKTGAVLK